MRRAVAVLLVAAAVAAPGAVAGAIGPSRLLSHDFGYAVSYRTVGAGDWQIRLSLYDHGRWSDATPPRLHANLIDDVAFADRQHGWIAAYDCARAAVYVYRTTDGARSWQALGARGTHSCGGGPTFLSFVDDRRGWMEPVSPNGPAGALLRTDDGGRTWIPLAAGASPGTPALPCLAPIEFLSRSVGWMARCGAAVFRTDDGGRRWRRVAIRVPPGAPIYDLPRFVGRAGVVASTLGRSTSTEVAFSVSPDGGRSWAVRSVRRIAACPLRRTFPGEPFWPTAVAGTRVWWIVAGRDETVVQVTGDAGRHWRSVVARGLPRRACAVTSVTAADMQDAWVVARYGPGRDTALYGTGDGGRTWQRVRLPSG